MFTAELFIIANNENKPDVHQMETGSAAGHPHSTTTQNKIWKDVQDTWP